MRMDYGKLYDEQVAGTYDEDELGLLAGARSLALWQIAASDLPVDATVVDLGVGTGETLVALTPRFPEGRFVGIDLSAGMIEIARGKLDFEWHVDDACNVGAHVPAGTADLVVAHFLTTFVDRPRLFEAARATLGEGGLFSVVSTTGEAFAKLSAVVDSFLGASVARAASPAPADTEALVAEVRAVGFEVKAIEVFRKPVRFESFEECLAWGVRSGFFAHAIEAIGIDRVMGYADVPGIFPLDDEYVGVALLAAPISR